MKPSRSARPDGVERNEGYRADEDILMRIFSYLKRIDSEFRDLRN